MRSKGTGRQGGIALFSLALTLTAFAATGILPTGARSEGKMDASGPYTSNIQLESQYTSEDFTPDGNLQKAVWKEAGWVRFNHDMSGRHTYPQSETKVAARWTTTHLYFAFWCRYSTLNIYRGEDAAKERWELWERDVVEVFVNPQPGRASHYYEFEVSPNNQWIDLEIDQTKTPFHDAGWNSNFAHATRVDSTNRVWTCEMRIPVASMGVRQVQPGDEWRINFYRADGPGENSQRRFMSWSTIPEGNSFHVPTRFGLIRFVK